MRYIHSDHLNTPQVVTDQNQQVVWKGDYKPFGEVEETVSAVEMPLRFPGQYEDDETGLNYNYFRIYDSATGRYLESDPADIEGGLNRYSYVGGRPMVRFDSFGLFASDPFAYPDEESYCGVPNPATARKSCMRECRNRFLAAEDQRLDDYLRAYNGCRYDRKHTGACRIAVSAADEVRELKNNEDLRKCKASCYKRTDY